MVWLCVRLGYGDGWLYLASVGAEKGIEEEFNVPVPSHLMYVDVCSCEKDMSLSNLTSWYEKISSPGAWVSLRYV